ncbi:MAG TPA: spore cortex biosynthesis protein YabQ [Bacillota bacterium]|nr:spore cortex biosynthesis protein YabQ [Bacillota bacterium]HOL10129.1 spore cortex biosynthesis protein YabQ [Bacillota bacterium]HPO97875.1 spore cortex biosynthesis protein YabQ [Bacillota bacterium]
MDNINLQLGSGLLLLLIGIILGGYIDFYRVFRGKLRLNKFLDAVGDLLFWVLAAVIFIPLMYWVNWLELRFYVGIALLVGLSFYYLCFSKFLIRLFLSFWRLITWLPRQLTDRLKRIQLFLSKINYRLQFRTKTGKIAEKRGG